ncbi:hypothetical protein [uncultured Litoreibacter sp.]|uniref:hypothetical protein n=1 Tax=uncultured Litoreibacter sp. TaxID=1392394 RepID=UPI0026311F47|nr:hypothetical protein [uncultured Litoreibacter sp.]
MILDLLNVVATAVLAVAALLIAKQANTISKRSVQLEADKHIFEWGQRCLNCLSRASSLRLISEGQISEEEFRQERRTLRAALFALKEEGALFFEKERAETTDPALKALSAAVACLDGRSFEPPQADDYKDTRKPQNDQLRRHARQFIAAVQARVGNEWSNRA